MSKLDAGSEAVYFINMIGDLFSIEKSKVSAVNMRLLDSQGKKDGIALKFNSFKNGNDGMIYLCSLFGITEEQYWDKRNEVERDPEYGGDPQSTRIFSRENDNKLNGR